MRIKYSIPVKYWMALSLLSVAVPLCPKTAMAQQDNLRRYITCDFGGKLSVEESDERAQPFVRSVNSSHGTKEITVLHGFSLHIAYAGTPFVNFKAERLEHFASTKQILIDQLVVTLYILNTPPEAPQFSTIEQYRELSVAFVQSYTACVAKNLA